VPGDPTRAIGAAALAVAVACSGLACGSSDDAPARGAASTQSRERPQAGRRTVWRRTVPAAYLRAPASSAAGQRGVRLSAHWLDQSGAVTETDPRGKVVRWPAPTRIAAVPAFRIAMPERPDRVDIRTFGGAVDAAGVPLEQPRLVACSRSARDRACRFSVTDRGVDVVLLKHGDRRLTRFVLYARWYVPVARRPARARSNPTVSASWGFVAAGRQAARR
jgi:hypothetical protein